MEPKEIIICKEDVGLRVVRKVVDDDYGSELLDSGVYIEETRGDDIVNSVFIGGQEIPKLIKALQDSLT